MELERLRELQEERDDVYAQRRKHDRAEQRIQATHEGVSTDASSQNQHGDASSEVQHSLDNSTSPVKSSKKNVGDQGETSNPVNRSIEPSDVKPSAEAKSSTEQSSASEPKSDHHKRTQDALAAAKERF
ncbi:hypothetical protein Lalb_Chr06g0164011 [Lupinus albus]|uniref:Uncharacterized protein n=1 Tax=Lupinus albus TaxID=3870 RepID=A0A6A4QD96_LUPAL|nr:hypothetical protein Lalb_Chr06g0164011 [Lupinus albus]